MVGLGGSMERAGSPAAGEGTIMDANNHATRAAQAENLSLDDFNLQGLVGEGEFGKVRPAGI